MDSPSVTSVTTQVRTLCPSSSGRRSSFSASPEFEFWMVRNPSFPQPNLLSADELFVDGVLLPLHLLPHQHPDPTQEPDPDPPNSTPAVTNPEPARPESSPSAITESTAVLTGSKRWRDIFKKSSTKNPEGKEKEKEKDREKKKTEKERKSGGGGGGASSAELNINIWPFSRSRSAGNAGTRPKSVTGAPGTRKVNSAPCSRSNSAGESKSKKWPSSPGRGGVHLGRSSPVWQVRRGGGSGVKSSDPAVRVAERAAKKDVPENRRNRTAANGGSSLPKARVLNLNVPICIGYGHHLSCGSDENSTISGGNNSRRIISSGGTDGGKSGNVGNGGNLYNLRSLFTKKVY
ncbi:hypothetical protein F2P56_006727 [Juglans regia]|uniref:Uncharacterized protein n=2 Tax=Juglans regia TaxID=51240 RepID=A0A834D3Q5_JUGRE|nr:uncharacterized protein LOC108997705 [Juglans regia]KAF5474873.1 hypothetical protein F2P56_006727 [Juglans regia]